MIREIKDSASEGIFTEMIDKRARIGDASQQKHSIIRRKILQNNAIVAIIREDWNKAAVVKGGEKQFLIRHEV